MGTTTEVITVGQRNFRRLAKDILYQIRVYDKPNEDYLEEIPELCKILCKIWSEIGTVIWAKNKLKEIREQNNTADTASAITWVNSTLGNKRLVHQDYMMSYKNKLMVDLDKVYKLYVYAYPIEYANMLDLYDDLFN